ncbi:MAG TPA: GNAT family N-acetyltransferase [Candidatus Eubacterium faecavium]|nr:GNAT family N-acetyltransferase [Candidatus Eubacterium faecavium]
MILIFLSVYGKVFKVFDNQDSGRICFGTVKDDIKYFIKFAGAETQKYDGDIGDAVKRLKSTVSVYEKLKHRNLIEYLESREIGNGFAMIFKWADGECMGRMYPESHKKFISLSNEVKLAVFADIMDFMQYIAKQHFVAIPGKRVYLYAFRILKKYRGEGYGKYLLQEEISKLYAEGYSEFTVGVEDNNERAIHIYKDFGFDNRIARKYEEYEGYGYEYNLYLKTM